MNNREEILKWEKTNFKDIEKTYNNFQPYNRLWTLAKEYQVRIPNILEGPLNALDRDKITKEILDSWDELFKMEKGVFKNHPPIKEVTN